MKPLTIVAISQDFTRTNPGGAALLRVMNAIALSHRVVCIGGTRRPEEMNSSIRYYRAPSPKRFGMLMAFVAFHLTHLLVYGGLCLRGLKPDVIQTVDVESLLGTVSTFHCCDAALRDAARQAGVRPQRGLCGRAAAFQSRLLSGIRICLQKRVCRSFRTRAIIALSEGSSRDIKKWYAPRIQPVIIPNSLS